MRPLAHAVCLVSLLSLSSGCDGGPTEATDPAASIKCTPSRECALELARAYALAQKGEVTDYYSHTLHSIAWSAHEHGDDAQLRAAIDAFFVEVKPFRRSARYGRVRWRCCSSSAATTISPSKRSSEFRTP